jgi:hypothetical protein
MMRLFLITAGCALAACSARHTDQDTAPASGSDAAAVEVRNLDFPDMTLYVLGATSSRVRLGVVNGNSTQVLTLPSYLVRGGDRLRFLADPIGGGRTPASEELFVAPGDTVTLTITPQ